MWRGWAKVTGREILGGGGSAGREPGGPAAEGSYCELTLEAPPIAALAEPGQFVHVLCPPGPPGGPGRPFLRRPFSVAWADRDGGSVTLVFRVRGSGTAGLAGAAVGTCLDVIGPLGRGVFPASPEGPAILVAGGVGLAPLVFLAQRLIGRSKRPAGGAEGPAGGLQPASDRAGGPRSLDLLLGLAGRSDLPLAELVRRRLPSLALAVSTEEGLPGTTPGLVTALFDRTLAAAQTGPGLAPVVYACGPKPMLARVAAMARERDPRARVWVSMEERMACGLGACRGCAVPVKPASFPPGHRDAAGGWRVSGGGAASGAAQGPGYALACRDGPVFDGAAVAWEAFDR